MQYWTKLHDEHKFTSFTSCVDINQVNEFEITSLFVNENKVQNGVYLCQPYFTSRGVLLHINYLNHCCIGKHIWYNTDQRYPLGIYPILPSTILMHMWMRRVISVHVGLSLIEIDRSSATLQTLLRVGIKHSMWLFLMLWDIRS